MGVLKKLQIESAPIEFPIYKLESLPEPTTIDLETIICERKLSSPKCVWDNDRYAGGSSTGSGIVVALGLCPFAIGSDSLGSIRVPSGNSGIVGLRPTFSRVSLSDCAIKPEEIPYLTIGPMACSVRDAAAVYLTMAGGDPNYTMGFDQPPLQPPNFTDFQIESVKFGYYREYISV
ncbi:Glutamyl-tRNA(Gln) amidotransferase subunit A [Thelohanellus kitauei]|uniref:Glutamyl-tRNA(Gln) amidotransferase subunit A n=1 Tax=Thelohanellus kitauei TaxID=669202 RepID=A0A0C2IJY7_THEKT|nr:Glutamyl-tRNA(Gln) amidotransferase subunit A [Thelohanellus kitauei]